MGHHLRSLQFLEYSHSKNMCVCVSLNMCVKFVPRKGGGRSCKPSRVCIAWETATFVGRESLQWPSLGSYAPTELLLILVTDNIQFHALISRIL